MIPIGEFVRVRHTREYQGIFVVAAHDGKLHSIRNLKTGSIHRGFHGTELNTPKNLEFWRRGDVVAVAHIRSEAENRGIVISTNDDWVRVLLENDGYLDRGYTDGYNVARLTFIEEATEMAEAFKVGDKVRFNSGPFVREEATVDTIREQGRMLWVRRSNGELSGGWFPSRFDLVKKRDSAEEVKNVVNNNAQTYEVALQGLRKLIAEGVSKAILRPRSWDTKGLYAAIEVVEGGDTHTLYTPEQVDNFIKARKPIDLVGVLYPFSSVNWTFRINGSLLRSPSGSSYWTPEEIKAAGGVVIRDGQKYRLGRTDFVPFV